MIPNPWVILGTGAAWLLSLAVCGWLFYARGHDDMRNAYTEQQLVQANARLANAGKNAKVADAAGRNFEADKPKVIERIHERTREIVIPPDADPFVPVWFVRLWDRLASGDGAADPYPGLADGAPSTVRLSGVRPVLTRWVEKYESCQLQVGAIRELNPVLPSPPQPERDLFDRLNPFN